MKKTILLTLAIIISYLLLSNQTINNIELKEDSLRVRIIPNSNEEKDQKLKNKVKENLETNLYNILKTANNTEEAKEIIKQNLSKIDKTVKDTIKKEKTPQTYKVNYGSNYFPEKNYNGIKYEEGYYESLVVTLGEGKGDNWWCVLFPPLCLIEEDQTKNIEYKSILKEIIKKYTK